jgi:hypothetical protein
MFKYRKCQICTEEFKIDKHHPYQKFCSKKCWTKQDYLINKSKILKRHKKRYVSKRTEILGKNKIYRELHKKEISKRMKKYNKNYFSERLKNDINYKILCNLRVRLWQVLKGISKSLSTIELIGSSINQLKQHLEKQFKKGMTWSNYGKWHIDHIRPCIKFDLSKPNEQRKCFHYTNLQPLWAEENLRKNKY